jgi:translation initiation factor IF-2
MIILQSQMMVLQSDLDLPAEGYVLESKIEKGRGSVATVICRHGTLKVGDFFSAGETFGKVIALKDSSGAMQLKVGPSLPAVVTGFDTLPAIGTFFQVIDEKEYRRAKSLKEEAPATTSRRSSVTSNAVAGVLNLVVKAEGNASLEALLDGIEKLSKSTEKPFFIVHTGVGNITENDVMAAENAGAYLIGFGVKAEHSAILYGRKTKIEIHLFDIIYRVFEDLEKHAKKNESIKKITTKIGEANVLKVFVVKKFGVVAGAYVRDGRFSDKGTVVVYRGKKVVGQGKIKSLQRDKKTVKEVHTGFECAFLIDGFEDWLVDDRVECFLETVVAPT